MVKCKSNTTGGIDTGQALFVVLNGSIIRSDVVRPSEVKSDAQLELVEACQVTLGELNRWGEAFPLYHRQFKRFVQRGSKGLTVYAVKVRQNRYPRRTVVNPSTEIERIRPLQFWWRRVPPECRYREMVSACSRGLSQ